MENHRRRYLGLSELGKCQRLVYYAHQPGLEPKITPEMARKFELGHLIEKLRRRELRRDGIRIFGPQREVAFGPAIGHIDGFLKTEAGPVLWEAKSTTSHSIRKWQQENLPRPIAFQIHGYMAGLSEVLGRPVTTCRLDVLDRTSGEAFVWAYSRDPHVENAAMERAVFLADALRGGHAPEREFEEGSPECRYCPCRSTCRPQAALPEDPSQDRVDASSWPGFTEALGLYEAGQELKEEGEQLVSRAKETLLGQLETHGATRAAANGALVAWSQVSTTKFDAKSFQAKMPEVYSQFLKPSSYQRLEVRR